MRRRVAALLGVGLGAGAGTVLLRRGGRARRERVDLYFDDGSMISLAEGSPEAARLLPVARRILASARSGR